MGMWNTLDQALQSESTQVVGHAGLGVGVHREAKEWCQVLAELSIGEAAWQQAEHQQRSKQRLYPGVAEA